MLQLGTSSQMVRAFVRILLRLNKIPPDGGERALDMEDAVSTVSVAQLGASYNGVDGSCQWHLQ